MELVNKLHNADNPREDEKVGITRSVDLAYNPSSERRFSRDDYAKILEGAEFLKEFEAQKGSRRDDLLTRLDEEEKDVPISRIYRLADDLGIGRKYVQEYIAKRFPSDEQQIEDLKRLGGQPEYKLLIQTYFRYVERAFRREFPNDEFQFKIKTRGISLPFELALDIYSVKKTARRTWFLKREKVVEKKSKVAQMGIWGMNMNLEFYDPCAVKVCGDTILEINKKLKEKFNVDMKLASVEYHYPIDLLKEDNKP